jgi:hypothetical protein
MLNPSKRTQLLLGAIVALAHLAFAIKSWPTLEGAFLPDTAGYIEFSPYRQPMYGLWANGVFALAGSWRVVQFLQAGSFVGLSVWVILEIASISKVGVLAAALLSAILTVLNRFGLINLTASLISEGLFYPMIMLMVALFLVWLRTGRVAFLVLLTIVLVAMTQLRTAAMLVITVPGAIAIYLLVVRSHLPEHQRAAAATLGGLVLGIALLPPLLGKGTLHLGTEGDTTGFAVLPRVSLLPVPASVAARSPEWTEMASSWRRAGESLNAAALTQFDGQLQEAIRYNLGPGVLLPSMLDRRPEEILAGWGTGIYYEDAKRIAAEWIIAEWRAYLRLSAAHLWGMLTIANFMDNPDRASVWVALNEVSPSTWRGSPMRTDYPLNRIFEPLKAATEWVYRSIRYACMLILALGLVSLAIVLKESFRGKPASSGAFAVAMAVGWVLAHSIPAALLVFPEFRYTYANMLVLAGGCAAWLAYLGAEPRPTECATREGDNG